MIFVVYSGRPRREVFDREVWIVDAENDLDAIEQTGVRERARNSQWVFGPHAKRFRDLHDAIDFAAYRASKGRQIYSHVDTTLEDRETVLDLVHGLVELWDCPFLSR